MRVIDSRVVDTLSLADRIALRTNMVDWLLLMPNIGAEFDVKGRNWNRWTVGLNLRGNWQTSHTFNPGIVYNIFEVRLDGRQYWRTRDMSTNRNDLKSHKKYHLWDKAVSIRRKRSKYPLTTFNRGLFVAYSNYSLKFGDTGRQGSAITAGISYGIQRPVYDFPNGNSLALEFAASVGAMYTKYNEYGFESEDNCYPLLSEQPWKLVKHPVISSLSVSLVYRLGTTPVTHKYRYRDDVDQPYALAKEERRQRHIFERDSSQEYNMTYKAVTQFFWTMYDSLAHESTAKKLEQLKLKDAERRKARADEKAAKKGHGDAPANDIPATNEEADEKKE